MFDNPRTTFLFIIMALTILVLSAIWIALYVELKQFRTGQPYRSYWPTRKISWTDVIIAFFAILSVVVAWQYTQISESTFEASNRPYIDIRGDSPALTLIESAKTECFHFLETNQGNVPAYNIREHREARILGKQYTVWYRGQPPQPHEEYLPPHEPRHISACTGVAYDYISVNMKSRTDNVPIDVRVKIDYQGVSKKTYHYHYYASYSNSIEHFVVMDEGESVE